MSADGTKADHTVWIWQPGKRGGHVIGMFVGRDKLVLLPPHAQIVSVGYVPSDKDIEAARIAHKRVMRARFWSILRLVVGCLAVLISLSVMILAHVWFR